MSKTIKNDAGEDEVVYTQAELDAQLLEKDEHVKQKLEEFTKGKTAIELEREENKRIIEEIKKGSETAVNTANEMVAGARKKVVDFVAQQYVGEDPELRKKLDEAFGIIEAGRTSKGLDIKDDKAIQEMMAAAASMSGISLPAGGAVPPAFMGAGMGGAPSFIKKEGELSDAEHKTFLDAVGYKPDAKPEEKK